MDDHGEQQGGSADAPANASSGPANAASGDTVAGLPSRRQMLMMGAVGAATVMSVRPALAQSAASVLNCSIPVPDGPNAGKAIGSDGTLVPAGSAGSFPGGQTFTGEDVRAALRGRSLPGTSYSQSQAYLNYIRRLQYGRSGFTCYASLQMPR